MSRLVMGDTQYENKVHDLVTSAREIGERIRGVCCGCEGGAGTVPEVNSTDRAPHFDNLALMRNLRVLLKVDRSKIGHCVVNAGRWGEEMRFAIGAGFGSWHHASRCK